MPNKSVKGGRRRGRRSQSQSQSENQNQNQNQTGGSTQVAGVPQISEATLRQAGEMAQQLMNKAMAPQTQNNVQAGGSALQGSEFSAAPSAAGPTAAGLKTAMVGGAVAGAVVGAEAYSSLKGSELVGGRKRRGRGRQSQSQSQSRSQSQSKSQKGGMVPGLLSAVETALVPLGLYLGQKALQSRRSGSRSLGKSFSFRRASRRTRRRR